MRRIVLVSVLFTALGLWSGTAIADQGLAGLSGYHVTLTPDHRLLYALATSEFTFTRVTRLKRERPRSRSQATARSLHSSFVWADRMA